MPERVLLTGASGFIGGRLHGPLYEMGLSVRCMTRRPDRARSARPGWDWVFGDVEDAASLPSALAGCRLAYYLVHGLSGARSGWAERERQGARRFAAAAARAGLERIIYLGGVAPRGVPSEHLRARLQTGVVLRSGAVPCLELRAGMIIGVGSASWQMVRELAGRLPAMVLPAWLRHRSEPVAVDDVIAALVAGARLPLSTSNVDDLPGPEALTGREILERVAAILGRKPLIVEVPFVSPRLSSHWIRWVTSVDHRLARELVEGLTSDLIAERHGYWVRANLPPPMGLEAAARIALREEPALPVRAAWAERAAGLLSRRAPPRVRRIS